MSEISGNDLLEQYRNVSSKLKKRLFRNPNIGEAAETYTALAHQFASLEMHPYAALCWSQASKCENSLQNIPGEAACRLQAGRSFLKAEEKEHNMSCVDLLFENYQASEQFFTETHYPDDRTLSVNHTLELVDFLERHERKDLIQSHLKNAISSITDNNDTKIICLLKLAKNHIDLDEFSAALTTYTSCVEILSKFPTLNGAKCDIMAKCEISRLFLLLILRPSPQKLSPELGQLLEKYTWGENDKTTYMREDCFLLLQSLVACCQSLDTSGLISLEAELWNMLDNEGKSILRKLVNVYSKV